MHMHLQAKTVQNRIKQICCCFFDVRGQKMINFSPEEELLWTVLFCLPEVTV